MKFTFSPESRPLEGYTIKRAIHRGGFGEVYYALSDAGREVALKLLQNNAEVELRGVQQCLNLSHPNLVTIFDVRQDKDDDYWIVMEYAPGETLDQVLKKHPRGMPVEQVRKWMSGIVAGVSHLHDRAIVHRDLKPGNVFSDGNIVKVGDIGLSKFITQSRRSAHTQSVGTVYYMAPEVAKGKYGKEVDVYALGIMLYEMLTGEVPFDGESTGEILLKHLSEPPNLGKLPPRLRPVVGKALSKDPALRFQSLREFEKAFTEAVLGKSPLPLDAPVPGSTPQGGRAVEEGWTPRPERDAEVKAARERTKTFLTTITLVFLTILISNALGIRISLFLAMTVGLGTVLFRNRHLWFETTPQKRLVPQPRQVNPPPLPNAPLFQRKKRTPLLIELFSRWLGSAALAVPVTALFAAGLAYLQPSLFYTLTAGAHLDPGALGLFAIISLVAAWGAMAFPMLAAAVGYSGTGHLRMHGLLLGLLVGVAASGVDTFLLVDGMGEGIAQRELSQEIIVKQIGERPLWLEAAGPTWLGYAVFFMTLFAFRNWTGLASAERRKRFSILSVLFTVGLAYLISRVFAFPFEWAMAWGAMIACVVQVCSPWSPATANGAFYRRS